MGEGKKEDVVLKSQSVDGQALEVVGDGTAGSPFIVSDVEAFLGISGNLGAFYKLGADIDLGGQALVPFGTNSVPFRGGLDGDGYAIKNIRIEAVSSYMGVFGYANSAAFTNLVMENIQIHKKSAFVSYVGALAGYLYKCRVDHITLKGITITGNTYCGTLAGYVSGGTISQCTIKGDTSVNGKEKTGGLTGEVLNGAVYRCCAAADVTAENYAGGIVGSISGAQASVRECYAIGNVSGNQYVGGLAGYIAANVSNSFAMGCVTSATNSTMTGGFAGYAVSAVITNCYAANKVSPAVYGFVCAGNTVTVTDSYYDSAIERISQPNDYNVGKLTSGMLRKEAYKNWDFAAIWDIEEGNGYPYLRNVKKPDTARLDTAMAPAGAGTEADPYVLKNTADYEYMRLEASGFYRMAADFDFENQELAPIAMLTGGFDGDGYAIKNYKMTALISGSGLFGRVKGAKIKNLLIIHAVIQLGAACNYVGALAGYMEGGTIQNVSATDVTVTGGPYCGGLLGYIKTGNIRYCSVRGNIAVTAAKFAGGLAGYLTDGIIHASRVVGEGMVSCTDDGPAGGIAASIFSSRITRSYAKIDVSGMNSAGGLAGVIAGISAGASECYATGRITAKTCAGGLTGNVRGAVSNCFARGSVTSQDAYAGGLIAQMTSNPTIANCYAAGTVNVSGNGLTPSTAGVTNSYFDRTLSGKTTPTVQARTTAQMQNKATYAGWSWGSVWDIKAGEYPSLINAEELLYQIPFALTVLDITYDAVAIEWPRILQAVNYEIAYMGKIESLTDTRIYIEDLKPDTDYTFRVRAMMGALCGAWSEILHIHTKAMIPVNGIHSTVKGEGTITVVWNAVADAESYEVVCNRNVFVTDTNTCVLTGLSENVTYTIYIKAKMADGSVMISNPVMEKIYVLNPQTEYAEEFITKCEGQTWFTDEIENLLNLQGKSINAIRSKDDFAAIYALGLADRGISGRIPAAVGELFALKYVFLANNNLSGNVPDELFALDNIIELDISGNQFSD